MTVNLARHLLKGLYYKDPPITDILSKTAIHIIPVIDNAFEKVEKFVRFFDMSNICFHLLFGGKIEW